MSPFRSFEHDAAGERGIAVLRLAGAIVVIGAAIWLVAVEESRHAKVFALLGVVIAIAWLRGFARAARRRGARISLRLSPEELRLDEGAGARTIAWTSVRAVDVDEDRLVIRVVREDGDPLIVEPIFGGVGVYALADAIRAAGPAAAPDRSGRSEPGAPGAPAA